MEQKKASVANNILPPHLKAIVEFFEFYQNSAAKLQEIEEQIHKIEMLLRKEDANFLYVKFSPDEKIREETVRDILGLRKKEFEQLKNMGLIAPIGKQRKYLVKDIITLKQYLENNKIF